ncbi:putative ferredoxin-like protein YdhX precursor [Botrimarina colliarenosi]|uniref:Putative ferredoxin-like protein YdhX n=1 Tax=Botrimarina colliarenosi TaxID=2528001 RepID=A0A5C6ACS1_9BACT|nr:cyclic nucleotide-binding domain-containing protein [Botrimarina colliarenosi]TWT96891.1 putative ferredoxin-like protein YdhX precursor [Botrimarina colliarenosi]
MLEVARPRPERWDKPLDVAMTSRTVDRLLGVPPFAAMDPAVFPRATPLREILRNDTRVRQYQPGEIVVREGDYGSSALLVLDGQVRATLESLPPATLGRTPKRRGAQLARAIAQLLQRPSAPEVRAPKAAAFSPTHPGAGVFVQDLPAVLDANRTALLGPGELFGEQAAITRSPHTATVFAETACVLLEIRWQGLRDLMQSTPALRRHVDELYRKNHLDGHLRNTPLLAALDEAAFARVKESVTFASYGSFDWSETAKLDAASDPLERLRREPIVVEEGEPVDAVLLVRGGVGRLASELGEGRRTIAYLGKGRTLGVEELILAAERGEPAVWRRTLSAVGRLDAIAIPPAVFLAEVAPTVPESQRLRWRERSRYDDAVYQPSPGAAPARTLDFLVDRRLVNGTQSMVIDLDRCTRCDDCLRACAATHDGNPRFTREGLLHDQLQFAQACMHCVDPVCMIGCPTGAIHRDEETGVVRINDNTCVGCSTCANSCPYSAIKMVEIREPTGAIVIDQATGQPLLRATKCDLCADQPTGPACQHACPHDALVRIDLTTPTQLAAWSQH